MPIEVLSDAEAAAYGRYDGGPSRAELDRVFFLDDADRELIEKRRGDVCLSLFPKSGRVIRSQFRGSSWGSGLMVVQGSWRG
jgi:hypothetical protein